MALGLALPAQADAVSDAMDAVKKHAGKKEAWDGPTSGPKAAEGKTIVVLAADMKNGGILGVTRGVEEAADRIGWEVRVLDGAGSVSGRTAAFGQALALQPDGIIINGFDAVEQQTGMAQAREAGIPLVSWHASPVIGPDPENGVFANVSTDANGRLRGGRAMGICRCRRQARRRDLHRLHLRHCHRQGGPHQGDHRSARRHGA